jgi:hypothetical protein
MNDIGLAPGSQMLVAIARTAARYGALEHQVPAPEMPSGVAATTAHAAVRQLFLHWNLDAQHARTAAWNPLSEFIAPGARVVLKPNWVLHYNQSGARTRMPADTL